MNCNIIEDLIPLYIDGCCSEESKKTVTEHIQGCAGCRKLLEEMKTPADVFVMSKAPNRLRKIHHWTASVMQSVLLFLSFALITVGVAVEARIPSGFANGMFAMNLVVPATGFMLSLAHWYFVRVYRSRKSFSNYSVIATLGITLCASFWTIFHYEMHHYVVGRESFSAFLDGLYAILYFNRNGLILTVIFCALSKILSNQYAKMLGKE